VPEPFAIRTEVPNGHAVEQLKLRSTILDSEIVALDGEGIPRFQLLQKWQKRPPAPVVCFLFDLPWSEGRDLTDKTVLQRRERLQQIITPMAGIQVGGYVKDRGKDLFKFARERRLGGIIAKQKTSVYRPGKRSPDWLKIKARPQQEFVVGGFTEGRGSRRNHFGALLLGAYLRRETALLRAFRAAKDHGQPNVISQAIIGKPSLQLPAAHKGPLISHRTASLAAAKVRKILGHRHSAPRRSDGSSRIHCVLDAQHQTIGKGCQTSGTPLRKSNKPRVAPGTSCKY
jgi:ATP dependent DNA ligase domain